ncbi:MAG: hypothetical protein RL238_897 [Actinomycetota bacterium]
MQRRRLVPSVLSVALLLGLAACGGDDSGQAGAVVPAADGRAAREVVMRDIAFDTEALRVTVGSTVEFDFTNVGKIPHDAFIGDAEAQAEHGAEMAAMAADGGGMDHHSMDEPAVTVQPGESASLTYTFDTPGTYEIGCHQPGHYEAGMKMTITVE